VFVTNALSPAKVQRVSIVDDGGRVMEVVVEDKQLSLAIGKKGQNVRLAAKLTGWRIDIKSEEEKRREVEAQFGELEASSEGEGDEAASGDETPVPYSLAGIGDKTVRKLVEAGFDSAEAVAAATVEQLSEIPGIGGKTAEKILASARGEAGSSEDESGDGAQSESAE